MNFSRARVFFAVVLALAGSVTAGAADKKEAASTAAQAVLLDHSSYPCQNCFLGNSDYYFCFDVNSKILIGHETIRVQTRKQAPEELLEERGKTVPIHFDDKYIWVPGPKGKDQRLTQDYTKKPFVFSDACQKAANK